MSDKSAINAVAQQLRDRREATIRWAREAADATQLEERELIGKMDYEAVKAALHSGSLSAHSVLCAFLHAALAVHAKTNCIVFFLKEAVQEAKEWDERASDPSFVKPPLFGLPLSVKDHIPLKGYPQLWGCASKSTIIADVDHRLVAVARQNGAIPFCLTTMPFTGLAADTLSTLFGQTVNPLNTDRSAGGSSGGESALISGGGSLLGIGSDVGGSVRIPASYCGIAGFKPTSARLSLPMPCLGRPFVLPTYGPMAHTISACAEFMKLTYADTAEHAADYSVPPLTWQSELFTEGRKYTIGKWPMSEVFTPTPGVLRALDEAEGLLEKAGHRVVSFAPPPIMDSLFSLYGSLIMVDGGKFMSEFFDAASGHEQHNPQADAFVAQAKMSQADKKALGAELTKAGNTKMGNYLKRTIETSGEMQQRIFEFYAFRGAIAKALKEQGVDALLLPTTVSPALRCPTPHAVFIDPLAPTYIMNLLDFPAGCIRMGNWNESDAAALADYPETDDVERAIKADCQGALGLPLSVQIAAPTFRDELALRVLCDLEAARDGRK